MECEENGDGVPAVAGRRAVKRKRRAGGPAPAPPRPPPERSPFLPSPFLNVNLMEEITFWICTRRAPCLYRYNNVYKKKNEEAQCSKYRRGSEPSIVDEVPSPKKKKKKLRLLDDDESVSTERQQNIYFEKSQKQFWFSSSESESDDGSDVDFNIRNTSYRKRPKTKSQRKNRTNLHKKTKLITSTPKPTTLRRSLRKTQQNLNSSGNLDCSFGILDSSAVNGDHKPSVRENGDDKNKSGINIHTDSKKGTILKEQSKNEIVPNGQFEDISDVSGFTANYIRSTKMNSKTPRKPRSKPSRDLVRESQKLEKDESKIIVCINKSVNTGHNPALNQSTDSSQNVIDLVSVNNNNNGKPPKIHQNTTQPKFLGLQDEPKECDKDGGQVNVSFQSKSSGASRYPTRRRKNSKPPQDMENSNQDTPVRKARGLRELRSINQSEQPDVSMVSRTRSGKKIGVVDSSCSQDQVNNLDPVSSSVTKNVTPANRSVGRKKHGTSKKTVHRSPQRRKDSESDKDLCVPGSSSPAKCGRRAVDRTRQTLKRDSLRDKSGFAACFSDSEEDKPLARRKFFC